MLAVGGYLPLLATGTATADLEPAFAQALSDRIFAPAGVTGARVLSDPRGVVDGFSELHSLDVRARPVTAPFAPGGDAGQPHGVLAPAGGPGRRGCDDP